MTLRSRRIVMIIDAVLAVFTLWLAVSLKNEEWFIVPLSSAPLVIAAPVLTVTVLSMFGVYRAIDHHLQSAQLLMFAKAFGLYGLLFLMLCIVLYPTGVPRSVGVIQPVLLSLSVIAYRLAGLLWREHVEARVADGPKTRCYVYGAGSAGRLLVHALKHSPFEVIGFIDDAPEKAGRTLEGLPVTTSAALQPSDLMGVEKVMLAMPSLAGHDRERIYGHLSQLGYQVVTVPRLLDLVSGYSQIADLRPLDIEDLLDRPAIKPNPLLIEKLLVDRVVAITGAAGSIGSELARQILDTKPTRLLLIDHSEFLLFELVNELSDWGNRNGSPVEVVPILASVCDPDEMKRVFARHEIQTVFHAAAYKHVHLLEENPSQGLKNNILGTRVIVECCRQFEVANMVLVSTDKAVRPSSVMGLSKRVSELLVQAAAQISQATCFTIVRFGNVLGSNGSVIPIFRKQLAKGGPLTVTSPEVTRFFMTIPEAAQLVIQAGAIARGGEVFILDMGDPVKITALAERTIELAGKTPTFGAPTHPGEVQIVFTGLKSGEKLHEELTLSQQITPTLHPKIFEVMEPRVSWDAIDQGIASAFGDLEQSPRHAVRVLTAIVNTACYHTGVAVE